MWRHITNVTSGLGCTLRGSGIWKAAAASPGYKDEQFFCPWRILTISMLDKCHGCVLVSISIPPAHIHKFGDILSWKISSFFAQEPTDCLFTWQLQNDSSPITDVTSTWQYQVTLSDLLLDDCGDGDGLLFSKYLLLFQFLLETQYVSERHCVIWYPPVWLSSNVCSAFHLQHTYLKHT